MPPRSGPLRLYGAPSEAPPPGLGLGRDELTQAGTYWVGARHPGHPHPRPVWGVWHEDECHLSVGSPRLAAALRADPTVTVHLGSGTDVVIVEGLVRGNLTVASAVAAYDRKYDWEYQVADYGDLFVVTPTTVLAWRSAGWAGREGFRETGRWVFRPRPDGTSEAS